jgi:hypothetical protein
MENAIKRCMGMENREMWFVGEIDEYFRTTKVPSNCYRFHFIGYNGYDKNGDMTDPLDFKVLGIDLAECLGRCKETIERKNWFVNEVVEYLKNEE